MTLPRSLSLAAAGFLAVVGLASAPSDANAQSRARHWSAGVSGPHHSAARGADIQRGRGAASVSRYASVDDRSWSSTRGRQTVATDTGYATTAVRVGPAGNSQTRTGEVSYGGDAYSRSSDVQTSSGRGYQHDVEASRDEEGATVTRSTTTNGGASRTATVVRPS